MSNVDDLHIKHWESLFDSELYTRLYPTWWDAGTANHWRHRRFMEPVLDMLQTKNASWLTIGDGSGHDSWLMLNAGFQDVLTTDIGVGTLKRSHADGHIQKYAQANAEHLYFADQQFDFVLCKEAFHHMQRPYMGLYEMLRVARGAVVMIEPQDDWSDYPLRSGKAQAFYEGVGNYVYTLSQREVQKVCLGMNLAGYACKNMYDVYLDGCEFAKASPDDELFVKMARTTRALEIKCQRQEEKWNYLMAIFFKDPALLEDPAMMDRLLTQGWTVEKTNTNPHLGHGQTPAPGQTPAATPDATPDATTSATTSTTTGAASTTAATV